MSLLRNITRGLRSLFRKEQVDQELNEELGAYLEMAAEEKMKQGMSRKEALRAVRLERGNLEGTKEVVRSAGWESFVETMWRDLRYGLRVLRKNPGFTAVAVLTLGLGIGLNTAIFTLFDALTLRPLPIRDPTAVVNIYQHIQDKAGGYRSFSYPEFVALRESNGVFSGLIAYSWVPAEIVMPNRSTVDGAEEAHGLIVTANYFQLLGGEVAFGRPFLPEEDEAGGAHAVIVLSTNSGQSTSILTGRLSERVSR
jgi:hypothetical protein